MRAFVLCQLAPMKTKEAVGKLPKPSNLTMGRWDCILEVRGETPRQISDQVLDQIRKNDAVLRTETMPVLTESIKPNRPTPAVKAYVFCNAEPAKTNQVFGTLASLSEVHECYTVAGRYDLVAVVGTNTWEDFTTNILNRIRTIDGICYTESQLVVS